MKLNYSAVEFAILDRTSSGSVEQKTLLKELSAISGEGYIYLRLRELTNRGMITRERQGGLTWCTITPAGMNLLAVMQTAKEAGL